MLWLFREWNSKSQLFGEIHGTQSFAIFWQKKLKQINLRQEEEFEKRQKWGGAEEQRELTAIQFPRT